jgi:hypothetical protein
VVAIVLEAMAAVAEDLLCTMMMTVPLVMPFIWGVLFGMHLVNSQETQVVCHLAHPCFKDHTVVAIVLETIVALAAMVATSIKEVGGLSSCLVLLYVRHHLSFQSKKNLEATMPLVIPFVWGVLFGMRLVNLQEIQVVCH